MTKPNTKSILQLSCSALTVFASATGVQAGECLYHSLEWSPASATPAAPDELRELRLVSIDVNDEGAFSVDMVSHQNAFGDADWRLPEMLLQLEQKMAQGEARHAMFKSGGTPFDMKFDRDTEIVYVLKPAAWRWAETAAEQFFLKPQNKDGVAQRHNPFTPARRIGERMMAVTFDYDAAYEGCAWSYNLGVVAVQAMDSETYETPLIIDPEGSTGSGGGIRD